MNAWLFDRAIFHNALHTCLTPLGLRHYTREGLMVMISHKSRLKNKRAVDDSFSNVFTQLETFRQCPFERIAIKTLAKSSRYDLAPANIM